MLTRKRKKHSIGPDSVGRTIGNWNEAAEFGSCESSWLNKMHEESSKKQRLKNISERKVKTSSIQ